MSEKDRDRRTAEPRREKPGRDAKRPDLFGPGAVGAWTDEELANLPEIKAPPEMATRDQDDAELMREGKAIEGRRKAVGRRKPGSAKPYGDWDEDQR